QRLEEMFSVTRPESEIAALNHAGGAPVTVSPETSAVLAEGLKIGEESGGALDVSMYPVSKAWGFTQDVQQVPDADTLREALSHVGFRSIHVDGDAVTVPDGMQVDLGALVKGYTGDRVMALFREKGAKSAIISLGGNVQTLGTKPDGSLWTVGIADPFSPNETLCTVQVSDAAVVTSGNYERYFIENGTSYHHILDPSDGYPAENGLVSVTIIGKQGLTCDALSTALFVEGTERAEEHWRKRKDFGMILVTDTPEILYTPDLADTFQNRSALPAKVIGDE
ncbi:MAG: FAD:protein FMN transferase, partial [Oscillospiraceae bacterium]|nr:FAD:protein FMN transferase [Oscillospiraceae bacterium]